jgi:hypothetical protein
VFLCSSDQKSPSLLLPDESCTMFSRALLDVLKNGDLYRPHPMSLRDIKELAEDRLMALPEKNAPRPGLYSPDQSEGDVADIPLFPNLRAEEERRRQAEETKRLQAEEQARRIEEERLRKAKDEAHLRQVEEEQRRQIEEAEQVRLENIAGQASSIPGLPFAPTASPRAVMPPQSSATLSPLPEVPPPLSKQPRRLPKLSDRVSGQSAFLHIWNGIREYLHAHSDSQKRQWPESLSDVVVTVVGTVIIGIVPLILLTLLLFSGSMGVYITIYHAATGNWPGNVSDRRSADISLSKNVQATATAAAATRATATWYAQHSGTSQSLYGVAGKCPPM